MNVTLYFPSYIVEEINNSLIGVDKGKVDKPLGWYSILMHICLFKGVSIFEKEINLERECDGEKLSA